MRISCLFTGCLVVGLAFTAVSAPAADKPKSKPKTEAPAAAPIVSPELKAFEKALNDLGPQAKEVADGSSRAPGAQMTAMLEKLKAVPSDKLPEDLQKAFTAFCAPLADMEALAKAIPADLPPGELKKWIADKKKSDPEAAKHLQELVEKMQESTKNSDALAKDLNKAATHYGLNLRPFLQPDSIGKELLKPAEGKTTLEKFVKDLEAMAVKRKEVVQKQKEKSLKTMADIAAITRAQTALLFEIPVDGLPEDLAAAFTEYREMSESYSWRVSDYPGDVPIAREETQKYIEERIKVDKAGADRIQLSSSRTKKGLQRRTEAGQELLRIAKTHQLDIAAFIGEKVSPAKE